MSSPIGRNESNTYNFDISHVSIDLVDVKTSLIDIRNQCLLMKKYAKIPPDEVLCQTVGRNVCTEQ